ncbi:HAMP domain-containing sensor histidine kinase [soil metagenome]
MGAFTFGLLVGWGSSLLVAAGMGAYFYRRFVLLARRARHAERLAELGTLTSGLAHEIKNPLSTVQLNLQLLQEDLDPKEPEYRRLINRLATVKNETSRLREILDDFLRYAGRIELERKPVELNALLEELVDFFAPQAASQRVQVRFQKTAQRLTAPVDAKLIKQCVLNLMINAVQAMDATKTGGGELILQLRSEPLFAVIDVIDTGSGIPLEKLAQIFDAYYTTKRGGTGLGLAMARRIAQEHGGDLSVQSEAGKGSDFKLTLPLR